MKCVDSIRDKGEGGFEMDKVDRALGTCVAYVSREEDAVGLAPLEEIM